MNLSFSATGVASVLRHMQATQGRLQESSLRLASGSRVARTAFDAAGAQIASRMRVRASGYGIAARGVQDCLSLMNTSEDALASAVEQIERIKELALHAMTGTLSPEDRQIITMEVEARMAEFGRIATDTEYNGQQLLFGAFDLTLRTGPDPGDTMVINMNGIDFVLVAMAGLDADTAARAETLHGQAKSMIGRIMQIRTERAADTSSLRFTYESLRSAQTPLQAAASRIVDTDYAQETAVFAREQILQQASVAVLRQAMRAPELALRLLRPLSAPGS